jgi:WD40 repeat protein
MSTIQIVWQIPSDDKLGETKAIATLTGHKRGVAQIEYNPAFADIIASASADGSLRVWSISEQKLLFTVELADNAAIEGISWSHDGALIALVSKDQKLRIVDPRAQSIVAEADAHEGVKAVNVYYHYDYYECDFYLFLVLF